LKAGTKSNHGIRRRTSVAIFLLWVLFLTLVSLALALEGPLSTPPGGVTLTQTGACAPPRLVAECIGRTGGTDLTFTDFDLSQSSVLYWGPEDANAVGLAFDCAIDGPGETMVLNLGQSDLANGVARWTGAANITYWDTNLMEWITDALSTRFTLTTTDLGGSVSLVEGSPLGIAGTVVLTVTGDFQANMLMEAFYRGMWYPSLELFDALQTRPEQENCAISQVDHGFYYEDEAITGLTQSTIARPGWAIQPRSLPASRRALMSPTTGTWGTAKPALAML
jgi:hypothetical protein